MKMFKKCIGMTCIVLYTFFHYQVFAQTQVTQVVYHIDDTQGQGLKGLRNLRNHLEASPSTKIIVVTHANGVDLLMEGAKDQKNQIEYAPLIADLKSRGVRFEVCEITLKNRGLKKEAFILDADYTPSGVVRIADLQAKEHFAYIKP
jgi:hypothetical protein